MEQEIKSVSLFIPIHGGTDRLHLKRICVNKKGPVIFMLHGSIENGKIFYSSSGKGIAPFLAQNGYDVYVADLRGRGQSTPPISKKSAYGQTEAINEDIPAFLKKISDIRGDVPQHWFGHSWGGVLLSSYLSRFPEYTEIVQSMVFFGTKRIISVSNKDKFINVDFFWNNFARLITYLYGYLPAKTMFGIGSDNETVKSHRGTLPWVKGGPWVDPEDSFDYGKAVKNIKFPPVLSITGKSDTYLGHPVDVKNFIEEINSEKGKFLLLGKNEGNLHDYGHIDILTHPDSIRDHFPDVLNWLQQRSLERI